jgi:hypothetical protein
MLIDAIRQGTSFLFELEVFDWNDTVKFTLQMQLSFLKTPSLKAKIVLFCEFTKDVNWKFKLLRIITLTLVQFVRNICDRCSAVSNVRKVSV